MRRLAIRPGGIGDTILSFPALEHLAANSSSLEVWCREEVLPLVQFAAARDSIARTQLDLLGLAHVPTPAHLAERLAAFDEVHSWYGTRREEFREALARLTPRVVFHDALPLAEDFHAADFFARQVGAPTPALPRIAIPAQAHRLILIHPFSGGNHKNWPIERFTQLKRYLEASGRAVEFLVAPRQQLPGARSIEDLAALAAWLKGAPLYIGNDSGITHLAAACGTPVLALFGPTNPRVWGPRGEAVEILSASSLDHISVDLVLDRALTKTGFL